MAGTKIWSLKPKIFISTKAKVWSGNKNIKLQVGFVSQKKKKKKKAITSGPERVY